MYRFVLLLLVCFYGFSGCGSGRPSALEQEPGAQAGTASSLPVAADEARPSAPAAGSAEVLPATEPVLEPAPSEEAPIAEPEATAPDALAPTMPDLFEPGETPRDEASPATDAVRFYPRGGGFSETLMLQLRAADPEAVIYYTDDGSLPSVNANVYAEPLEISATTLIRAVSVREGRPSPVYNHSYFRLDSEVAGWSSSLPTLVVHMLGRPRPDALNREYVPAVFGEFRDSALNRAATLTSRIGIKVRGRSSRLVEKQSFTFELHGRDDEDAPASLLGMPADGDWVLYAPFTSDPSLMHNAWSYALSNQIGRYAPRTRYCEVFLVADGEPVTAADYAGIYVLTERIRRSSERVPITKLRSSDLIEPFSSGGYIVQLNEPDDLTQSFRVAGWPFEYVQPHAEEIQPEQAEYIHDYLEAVVRALRAADGVDPLTEQHYEELIDVDSFIDFHILNILVKNPDAFELSTYFHKDRGGKLIAGPIWDFDLGIGGPDARSLDPRHWGFGAVDLFSRSLWGPLFEHPEFERAYWARWRALLDEEFSADVLRAGVDVLAAQLTEAEPRNTARWPQAAPRYGSFAAEAGMMRAWLEARVTWIKGELDARPARFFP